MSLKLLIKFLDETRKHTLENISCIETKLSQELVFEWENATNLRKYHKLKFKEACAQISSCLTLH